MSGIVEALEIAAEIPVEMDSALLEAHPSWKELRKGSVAEKAAEAYALKMRGLPVASIAAIFDVSVPAVYKWLKQVSDDYRSRIENVPAANLIADSLQYIDHIADVFLYEAANADTTESSVDATTGEVIRKVTSQNKTYKAHCLENAVQCRKLMLDLMLKSGVLPKTPEHIYHTMKGEKPVDEKEKIDDRTPDQIGADIAALLKKGRRF